MSQPRDGRTSQKESLAELAYKQLEKKIITAEIAPGDWITEPELGASLGISRTPIRAALQRLSRARLIEIVPRRGLRVTSINVSDQLVLLDFRRTVERFIAAKAARHATPEERQRFGQLAADMEHTAATEDYAEHYRVDLECKLQLLRSARNEYAANAIEPLWAASRRFAWVTRHSRDIPRVARLTAAMMQAIASGDQQGAADSATAFVDCLEELARRTIDDGDGSKLVKSSRH